MEQFDWSVGSSYIYIFITYENIFEKLIFFNCFTGGGRIQQRYISFSCYYRRYLLCYFFVVHEIQPHPVLIAILHPLSLWKFTKVIAEVFTCCHDCKEMERVSYYESWLVTKVAMTIV